MTHEFSDPAVHNDYLAKVLAPALPLLVLGRSKDAEPKIKGEHAMWYAWKELCALSLSLEIYGIP